MAGDRSILPSPARVRRGWRAGLRARSRWLDTAAAVCALALVVSSLPWSSVARWGPRWRQAIVDPSSVYPIIGATGRAALAVALVIALAVALGRTLAALVTGRVGATSRRDLEQLDIGRVRWGWGLMSAAAAIGIVVLVGVLRGVVAGAARGADASARGLSELWSVWPSQLAVVSSVVLTGLGLFELWVSRRRTVMSLMQSPAELREDARTRGGGRR